ncbi:MAG: hypothetical protein Sapg2KO_20560 [Saprospiraceae bacterium]
MTTQEIANRLVDLCRTGQHDQAYKELFSKDAVSVEPAKWNIPDTTGIDALLAKSKQWQDDVEEIHDGFTSDPIVAGNFFTVSMKMDLTTKSRGRSKMEEICVYEVEGDKIVKEQFFH